MINLKTLALSAALATLTIGAQAADIKIMTALPSLQHPFFVHMQSALDDEADKLGDIELIRSDGGGSSPKQTADVENAIVQGVDGIVISPNDVNALAPAIEAAIDAGIPVVTIDRRVDNVDGILAHVGADNVVGGEIQAEFIVKMFPDGGTVVNLRGQPGASPAIDRNQGLHNVLDGMDKYNIVAEQTANWNRSEALNVTNAILSGLDTPPDVVNAANDEMALGAVEALRAASIDAPVVAFDAGPEALIAIRDGKLAGAVDQFPGLQSREAMRILVDYLRAGTKPDQQINLIRPKMITSSNLDDAERVSEIK